MSKINQRGFLGVVTLFAFAMISVGALGVWKGSQIGGEVNTSSNYTLAQSLENPGTLPTDHFYPVKQFFEMRHLSSLNSGTDKLKYTIHLANTRLAEAYKMAINNTKVYAKTSSMEIIPEALAQSSPSATPLSLTVDQMIQEAQTYLSRAQSISSKIGSNLSDSRKSRDVVKTLCLTDKQSQIDVTTRGISDRLPLLQSAASASSTDNATYLYRMIVVLAGRSEQIFSEANQCIGADNSIDTIGTVQTQTTFDEASSSALPELPPQVTDQIRQTLSSYQNLMKQATEEMASVTDPEVLAQVATDASGHRTVLSDMGNQMLPPNNLAQQSIIDNSIAVANQNANQAINQTVKQDKALGTQAAVLDLQNQEQSISNKLSSAPNLGVSNELQNYQQSVQNTASLINQISQSSPVSAARLSADVATSEEIAASKLKAAGAPVTDIKPLMDNATKQDQTSTVLINQAQSSGVPQAVTAPVRQEIINVTKINTTNSLPNPLPSTSPTPIYTQPVVVPNIIYSPTPFPTPTATIYYPPTSPTPTPSTFPTPTTTNSTSATSTNTSTATNPQTACTQHCGTWAIPSGSSTYTCINPHC